MLRLETRPCHSRREGGTSLWLAVPPGGASEAGGGSGWAWQAGERHEGFRLNRVLWDVQGPQDQRRGARVSWEPRSSQT